MFFTDRVWKWICHIAKKPVTSINKVGTDMGYQEEYTSGKDQSYLEKGNYESAQRQGIENKSKIRDDWKNCIRDLYS